VINSGVATAIAAASCSATQASTTGTGTGATWTATFAPIAGAMSFASLATGGSGVSNGNLFLGAETPSATYSGAEGTFVGDRAGAGFTGAATANSAFGHNACGLGAGATATGSFNSCLGNDAGRNITGSAQNNTLTGQNSGRILSGSGNTFNGAGGIGSTVAAVNNNTIAGFQAAPNVGSDNNSIFGQGAAANLGAAFNNSIYGRQVGSALVSGTHNLIVGTSNACDTVANNTSNSINLCAGGSVLFRATGTNTPTTATSTQHGAYQLPDIASSSSAQTGTLCWTTSTGNITVDTTTTCLLSSARFKHDIRPLEDPLKIAMALKPVSYEYNEMIKGEQVGLVAEDVAAVDPRLVSTEADGTPRAVRYQQLTAVLAGAIQKLKADNDNLRECQKSWKCRLFGVR